MFVGKSIRQTNRVIENSKEAFVKVFLLIGLLFVMSKASPVEKLNGQWFYNTTKGGYKNLLTDDQRYDYCRAQGYVIALLEKFCTEKDGNYGIYEINGELLTIYSVEDRVSAYLSNHFELWDKPASIAIKKCLKIK